MSDEVNEFFGELGAGVFEQKLVRAISQTALAVMQNEKTGEITLKFKIAPVSSSQARVTHSIITKAPTLNGETSEKNVTNTIMYVGTKGKMSVFPENQLQMFSKSGETTATNQG